MKIISRLKAIPRHLPTGTGPRNFTGFLVDKGERYGAAAAFGFAKGYYGERFLFKGHGLDLWLGAGLTLAAAGLQAFSGGRSQLADHVERVGDAGMMSALGSLGAAFGAKKSGRQVAVISPGQNALPASRVSGDVVGAIPPAVGGAYLSADDIARFASRR